jgi:glucokinase
MSVLVFDIGGTHLRMAIGEADQINEVSKMPTPHDPNQAIAVITEFAKTNIPELAFACGGVPGLIENGIVHSSPHLPEWNDCNFADALSNALHVPVQIANDAEMAGLGEAVYGAGKNYELVTYIGIGTGIGGSYIVHKKVAPHASAGGFEPGRQVLDVESGTTFEEYNSGSALEKRFDMHPKDLSPEIYTELLPILVAGLRNVILTWSPEILVLGGSLMNETNGYRLHDVTQMLQATPDLVGLVPVVAHAALGDENGLYGALAASTSG